MDVSEAEKAIYDLTKFYFKNAAVVYAKQSFRVKPTSPLVTISLGSLIRPLNPPQKIIDGRPVSFYPSSVVVQIDLFTRGRKLDTNAGEAPIYENTAVNDMAAFADFLNSDYAVWYCRKKDIAVVILNTVQDLTELINDTNYSFRAMLEFELRFTSYAVGYSGTLSMDSIKFGDLAEDCELVPEVGHTSSGGGNDDVCEDEGDYFTNVSINDKLVKEKTNEFKP